MKCKHCGKEIESVLLDKFNNYDGCDSYIEHQFYEADYDACVIETDENWCGYGQSEDEMRDSIKCPNCHKFPFDEEDIQIAEVIRIICFKKSDDEV